MWNFICYCFSLTQLCLILWTCCSGLQPARPPCPSSSPRVFPSSSSCPLHQRCHQAILSSVTLFSFCPQSFIESGAFPMSRLFTSDYQNIGASVSASVLPMSVQGGFPLRLTGLISLLARGSQESSPAPEFKGTDFLVLCLLYSPDLTAKHAHWEDHSLDYMDLSVTICSDFGAQEEKICHYFHIFPLICREVIGPECHELNFF